MNYSDPDLLARLAADYVLGTMPPRSRRRFEKIALDSPAARRALRVAEEQLLPFAAQLPPRQPPDRVWRAIESRVQPAARTSPAATASARAAGGWWQNLVFWRSGALVALGLFLALGVTQFGPRWWQAAPATTAGMGGLAQSYVAVLSDTSQAPAFLISAQRYQRDVHIKVLRPQDLPPGKVLRLWALPAGGEPRAPCPRRTRASSNCWRRPKTCCPRSRSWGCRSKTPEPRPAASRRASSSTADRA